MTRVGYMHMYHCTDDILAWLRKPAMIILDETSIALTSDYFTWRLLPLTCMNEHISGLRSAKLHGRVRNTFARHEFVYNLCHA